MVELRRDLDQARARARRRVDRLLHQQHPRAPARRRRHLPRHRPGRARLRDHRAGHDLARDRGQARGAARLPRGGGGRLEVPRAAARNRAAPEGHAGEPAARGRHPPGARQAARAPARPRPRSRRATTSCRAAHDHAEPAVAHAPAGSGGAARPPRRARSSGSGSSSKRRPRRLREAERQLEELRDAHYRASDEVHAAQGAFYEANAETARLEQEIAHVRENRQRVEREIAELRAQLARDDEQRAAARGESRAVARASAPGRRSGWPRDEAALQARSRQAAGGGRSVSRAHATATTSCSARSRRPSRRCRSSTRSARTPRQMLDQLAQRDERLREERGALPAAGRSGSSRGCATRSPALEDALQAHARRRWTRGRASCRSASRRCGSATPRWKPRPSGSPGSRRACTRSPSCRSASSAARDWRTGSQRRGSTRAPRLWQGIRIEPGWEDALEAVLRERLNGIALEDLDARGALVRRCAARRR